MPASSSKVTLHRTAQQAARAAGVSRTARLVLEELVEASWPCKARGDGWAVNRRDCNADEITQAELARRVDLKPRALRQQIRDLESARLIRVRPGRGRACSKYHLMTGIAAALRAAHAERDRRLGEAFDLASDAGRGVADPPIRERHENAGQSGTTVPVRAASPCRSERHRGASQGDLHLTALRIKTDTNTGRDAQAPRAGAGANRRGAGEAVDPGRGLNGRAAVVYERLRVRPPWLKSGRWITQKRAAELARIETVTLEVVDAALAATRDALGTLDRPAGFAISRILEPDMHEIAEIQATRRAAAERDRRAAEDRARRERERADAFRVADELERRTGELLASVSQDELDELIDDWIRHRAGPLTRDRLWHRTPDERRGSLDVRTSIEEILEGRVTA